MTYFTSTRLLSITPKLRARLIKFRHGAARDQQTSSVQRSTSQQDQNQASGSKVKASQPGEAIWDFEIPPRWRRRPLDEQEIAVINNGGRL